MIKSHIKSLTQTLIVSSLLTVYWIAPVLAAPDQQLTSAEVYKLIKMVELLLQNQTQRPAKQKDIIQPRDAVRTGVSSEAQLFFNDKSLIRVDQSSTFRFEPGLRRFQLPNRIALLETIFKLENGTALILSPPGSVATEIATPESQISILAPRPATISSPTTNLVATKSSKLSQNSSEKLFIPAQKASAVLITHNTTNNTTQVFALTDGDIKISDQNGKKTVALQGGQTVAVKNGVVGTVQEFDLQGVYKLISLTAGLGPGQETIVAQESPPVKETINAVRMETLAALRNQAKRFAGFAKNFVTEALDGESSRLNPRPSPSIRVSNPQRINNTDIPAAYSRSNSPAQTPNSP
ncbi:MAG: hypothetical protein ACFKPT_09610 [Gloeotrichia echinulata GP01]